MSFYDKYILPKVLNCTCASKPIRYQRDKIVPLAEGVVLDVGIGSGLNIPFYNKSKINYLYGLDPSKELLDIAKSVANKENLEIEFLECGAESIPLPDKSIDTVLITYTMCTIPDVALSNSEIMRVLKDDGKLLFCEHGLAPDKNIAKWQKRINPLWGKIAGGCNLNRDIPKLISSSGFKISNMEEMYLPSTPKFAGYNYWGVAKK
ncbi:class I SAM-dependent methyltransferase [Gammaproteobacteria bacterium]|nr:class I SAM-dependent methyltransferase [Gammaproteobacteria bacterium]MDC0529173.1 class I SAM-dependent methyltransferase [Gammaproteobacteria bacterium]MDC3313196.1 class I SAM-dependent methyltransferase [Gammaproteobacteria bacterium]